MNSNSTSSSAVKKLAFLFLAIAGLHYAKTFLMPLAIGGVLATLFLPFCKWIEKKKIPRGLAAMMCLILLLVVLAGVIMLLGWEISEITNDFSLIKEKAIGTAGRIQEFIFNQLGISVEKQIQILKDEQPSLTGIVKSVGGSLTYVFTNFILILAYVFLLLYYRIHIKHFFIKLTAPAQRDEMEQVIYGAMQVSQQYLSGLAKMIVCLWIMYGIGFSLLGIRNALFFSVLCGLLEIIPFIGNLTGTTLTVLVAAVQGAHLPVLGGIVVTYGFVQFIQGWVLEPLIVGKQVKINPLFTIIALVVGELVWGVPGIFLAIPLTAMLKIAFDHIKSLKPYGFLIGEIEEGKAKLTFIKKVKNLYKKQS